MGMFETPKERRKQYTHVTAKGTAWDLHKINEIERKRQQRAILLFFAIITLVVGLALIYYDLSLRYGVVSLVISLILFIILFPKFFSKSARKLRRRPKEKPQKSRPQKSSHRPRSHRHRSKHQSRSHRSRGRRRRRR